MLTLLWRCSRPSVLQAVAQTLALLQGCHGQLQVLPQALDLPLAPRLHVAQLLVHLLVARTGRALLLGCNVFIITVVSRKMALLLAEMVGERWLI